MLGRLTASLALATLLACEHGVHGQDHEVHVHEYEGHVHDHTPRHGGVVAMSGSHHVEALARRDGVLRFYVSDFARHPVPMDGARGRATLQREGSALELPLVVRDGALEARTAPLAGELVEVRMEVTLPHADGGDEHLLIDFTLPVVAG